MSPRELREPPSITLSAEEITALSGGYRHPAAQLEELHQHGFWRARFSRVTGMVVLERAHYLAVCTSLSPKGRPRTRTTTRAFAFNSNQETSARLVKSRATLVPSTSARLLTTLRPGIAYSVNHTAEMLDVSRSTVYRLVRAKRLKLIKVGKRGSRIPAESLSEFLESRSTPEPR